MSTTNGGNPPNAQSRVNPTGGGWPRPGEQVSLNPQPEPPGFPRPRDRVSLNPQPEPPGAPVGRVRWTWVLIGVLVLAVTSLLLLGYYYLGGSVAR